jgi:hypothetical protein
MYKKIFLCSVILSLMAAVAIGQGLSPQEIVRSKAQITKLQKEITRLKNKLAKTKVKKLRIDILDKIDADQGQINKIKNKLYPKKAEKKAPVAPVEPFPTIEAMPEEMGVSPEAETAMKPARRSFKPEVGGVFGFFAGATTLMGEVRFPLSYVIGPATTSLRLATGLAQSRETDRRFVPLNFDVILDFPPGWLSGVENYLGAGLNYVALTSGSKQGTVGGEIFYGVQSEGFDGMVFGELGYGILRTGFSASHKGATALFGYRKPLGF